MDFEEGKIVQDFDMGFEGNMVVKVDLMFAQDIVQPLEGVSQIHLN